MHIRIEKDTSQEDTPKRPPTRHGRGSSKRPITEGEEKLPPRPVTREGRD